MLFKKIEVAKDTVHQFTNQVITVSDSITKSSRDYITRDEVLDIFQQNQELYSYQTDFIIGFAGIAIAVFGLLIPIIQYFNNRKYEKDINDAILGIDSKIEKKVIEKIQSEFDKKITEETEELKEIIKNLTKKANKEDKFSDMRIEIPIKMLEGYLFSKENKYLSALKTLIEALYNSLLLGNQYYINSVDVRIHKVIDDYEVSGKIVSRFIKTSEVSRIYGDIIVEETDSKIRNKMDYYINKYRNSIESINNTRQDEGKDKLSGD